MRWIVPAAAFVLVALALGGPSAAQNQIPHIVVIDPPGSPWQVTDSQVREASDALLRFLALPDADLPTFRFPHTEPLAKRRSALQSIDRYQLQVGGVWAGEGAATFRLEGGGAKAASIRADCNGATKFNTAHTPERIVSTGGGDCIFEAVYEFGPKAITWFTFGSRLG